MNNEINNTVGSAESVRVFGRITLDGTLEEIYSLCSILENNGIVTE